MIQVIALSLALCGQIPADPGLPWKTEAERLEWIKTMKFQRAYFAAEQRRQRLASRTLADSYPHFYYGGYSAQQMQALYQLQWMQQVQWLQLQQFRNNSYGYGSGNYYRYSW